MFVFSCNSTSQSSKIDTETKQTKRKANVMLARIICELDDCKQAKFPQSKPGRALGLFSFVANRLSRHLHKHPTVLRVKQEILLFNKKTKYLNYYHPIS